MSFILNWWTSNQKKKAFFVIACLLLIGIVEVCANVGFGKWQKSFYDALEKKDSDAFFHQIFMFLPISALVLTSFVGANFLKSWASFEWRKWMTADLIQKWFDTKSYYKIPLHFKTIDNPDQRITQDIHDTTQKTIDLFTIFFKDGLNFITFSITLWILSQSLSFMIPGFLLWMAVLYALLAIIITFKIGRPLIVLDQNQESSEANFRYKLMRIMERREEIAKMQGENYEQSVLKESFFQIQKNYFKILTQKFYLNTTEILHGQGNMFVPLLIVVPLYFKNLITLGALMQIRFMFYEVYRSLSSCAYEYQKIASLRASLKRLIDFVQKMDEVSKIPSPLRKKNVLHIENLEIFSPKNDLIWSVSDFTLNPCEKKVLCAPSGTGKTSFLRVISGIYSFYKGDLMLPLIHQIMIIPQRPYMPLGTLKHILTYPNLSGDVKGAMKLCGIEHLISFLDLDQDYQQILSYGEQQRIQFARALLQKPDYLIMDEPVSGLDSLAAKTLLSTLRTNLESSAILILSHEEIEKF